ncbi:hypothetical protein AGMMS4952_24690 [Spirochaetia bacterium]|nr:hypothetical protein AGMMS4952_24690 [Spirochaetia bacterium]
MKKKSNILAMLAGLLVLSFALMGCGGEDDTDTPPAFVAVTDITSVPTTGTVETELSLSGATVVPNNATRQTIEWEVKTVGMGYIIGNSFTPLSGKRYVNRDDYRRGGEVILPVRLYDMDELRRFDPAA